MQPSHKYIKVLFSSLAVLLIISLSRAALAQTSPGNWSPPLNLSRSGVSSEPRLIIDASGEANVVWLDEFAGLRGARSLEGKWPAAVALELPFQKDMPRLKLFTGPDEWVHAAWTDEKGSLFYSRARGQDLLSPAAWSGKALLAAGVAGFDLAAADGGVAYLAYARAEETTDYSTGVYMIRTIGSDIASTPRQLYNSAYFRSLEFGQVQLSIAAGNQGQVYVAWDDPALEKIALAVSSDRGETWSAPAVVDRRQASDGDSAGPSRPLLSALGGDAVLVWQAGHAGSECGGYFQSTTDGGQNWSMPAHLSYPLDESCAESSQLLTDGAGATYLLAVVPSGVQLLSWNMTADGAGIWSSAHPQNALSGFTNPETYRPVDLGCLQGTLKGSELFVVGCEQDKKGDIWLLERTLDDSADWFPTATAAPPWSTPALLDSQPGDGSSAAEYNPVLLSDANGRLHALWTRPDDPGIYYAVWDGDRWSTPQSVLTSPGQSPLGLTAVSGTGDQLFVAWSDPSVGRLFYSLAPAAQALDPARWLASQELPVNQATTGLPVAPQALARPDGKLVVAYAVQFNEQRGIYLIESQTAPQNSQRLEWSAPGTVFDAAAAGWDSLSDPRLALDGDGRLHALWTRYRLPPDGKASGLYAADQTSSAALSAWSAPTQVVDGQVVWTTIASNPETGELHRSWQQVLAGQVVLFHQYSSDGGQTWSSAARVDEVQSSAGPVGLVFDGQGRLNLLQATGGSSGVSGKEAPILQRWMWVKDSQQNGVWQVQDSQPLSGLESAANLSVAASPSGLAALYSGIQRQVSPAPKLAGPSSAPQSGLFFTSRSLGGGALATTEATDTPETSAASKKAPQPTSGNPASATPPVQGNAVTAATPGGVIPTIDLPTPRPTAAYDKQPPGRLQSLLGGEYSLLLIGAIPAALLVIAAFILLARKVMRP